MATPRQDTLSASELAEQYGWAQAVLNSDAELNRLFREAVKGQWSPERFQARLRATDWYRKHSESWRQAETQRLTDPKTYQANIDNLMAQMRQQASAMGAVIGDDKLRWRAEQAYKLGWNQQQIQVTLGAYVKAQDGVLKGAAGQTAQQLRELAYANGVRYQDSWFNKAAQAVVSGTRSADDFAADIRANAASAFPAFRDQIKAGVDVIEIASPYRQAMSALLEIPDADVDLYDPKIRQALSYRDKDGQARAKSLWEFENEVRKDTRWMKTNNARDEFMGTAQAVLDAWGFRG
jgi:hypothetical protein